MKTSNILSTKILHNVEDGRNGWLVITEASSLPVTIPNVSAFAIAPGSSPNKIATLTLENLDNVRAEAVDITDLTVSSGNFNLSCKNLTVTAIEVGGPSILVVLGEG